MTERDFDISGALTFWALRPTPYQALLEALEAEGYGECMPNVRTDQSALENAIKASYGMKNRAVVSRKQPKRNGVELVEIERNPDRNYYTTSFGARVVDGAVKADFGYADEYRLTEEFLKCKAVLTTAAVSQALTAVLARMSRARPQVPLGPELHVPPRCDQVMAILGSLVDRVKNHELGPDGKPTEKRWLAAIDCFAEVAKTWLEPAIAAAGGLYFAVPHASVLVKAPVEFSNAVLQVHRNITAAA